MCERQYKQSTRPCAPISGALQRGTSRSSKTVRKLLVADESACSECGSLTQTASESAEAKGRAAEMCAAGQIRRSLATRAQRSDRSAWT